MNITKGATNLYKQWYRLDTPDTSYVLGATQEGYLLHLYYGTRLSDGDMNIVLGEENTSWYPLKKGEAVLDKLPLEYPTSGMGDLRPAALTVLWEDDDNIADLRFVKAEILSGKPKAEGLPQVYTDSDDEAQTLVVTLEDEKKSLECRLFYTAFSGENAISRRAEIENKGSEKAVLYRAQSATLDLPPAERDFLHLYGAWSKEFTPERVPVSHMTQSISSIKGASGHLHNPFGALLSKDCTEESGEAIGMSLIYSGNFVFETDMDITQNTRANIGISDRGFRWNLNPGESFETPEAVLVYSNTGIGEMSRTYHRLYRSRVARSNWRDKARPALINTWEGVYFDFNSEKLLTMAKAAADTGVELFVLDDGWFGKRDDDTTSLGDWYVNEEKLGCSLKELVDNVNKLGLKFGIWVEPEMISPVSDLYEKHPDWALCQPNRPATLGRNQLILDLSQKAVQDYIIEFMKELLNSAPIEYIKWDMNRNFTEVGSFAGTPSGELPHRYMLGLYRVLEEITQAFPDVLFESCASGGGRYDAGMLYYMPQTWLSDDTDASERVLMQYGASIVYPASSMGSHVSVVPNHQMNRTTSMETRFNIASMGGGFGYELDLAKLSDEDKAAVKEQVRLYKEQRDFLRDAEIYRLNDPSKENFVATLSVSSDKKNAVLTCFMRLNHFQWPTLKTVKLAGLNPQAVYKTEGGEEYTGAALMSKGVLVSMKPEDFSSVRIHLSEI